MTLMKDSVNNPADYDGQVIHNQFKLTLTKNSKSSQVTICGDHVCWLREVFDQKSRSKAPLSKGKDHKPVIRSYSLSTAKEYQSPHMLPSLGIIELKKIGVQLDQIGLVSMKPVSKLFAYHHMPSGKLDSNILCDLSSYLQVTFRNRTVVYCLDKSKGQPRKEEDILTPEQKTHKELYRVA